MMQLHGEKLYWQVFQPEVQKSVEKHFLGFGKNKKKITLTEYLLWLKKKKGTR